MEIIFYILENDFPLNSFGHLFMLDANFFHSFLQPYGLQPCMETLPSL